jgi:hypothetical protein
MAARFIDLPPEPPCILALFRALEPALVRLNSEAEDDNNLQEEKAGPQLPECCFASGTYLC